jgi:hypothetical protein
MRFIIMTHRQFKKMTVFALRMVPVAIGGGRWRKELRGHVTEILCQLDDGAFACHWDHIVDWDNNTRLPDDDGTCGFAWNDGRMLLCDFMSEYCWDTNLEREKTDRHGNCEVVETKMEIALRCCIRAACDVAVAPSAGVLGFTVGDLRLMWKNRTLPKWVRDFFEGDIVAASDTSSVWL